MDSEDVFCAVPWPNCNMFKKALPAPRDVESGDHFHLDERSILSNTSGREKARDTEKAANFSATYAGRHQQLAITDNLMSLLLFSTSQQGFC